MRELKFRAWDTEEKSYVKDPILFDNFVNVYVVCEKSRTERGTCLITGKPNVILEQYIGLKDKNDKCIYEGDILKFRGRAYEVKFDNYGQFYMENKNYHWLENGYSFRSVDIWCAEGILVEVVGNIHDNPELLTKYEDEEEE